MLARIARMPTASKRAAAMRRVGEEEFARCKEDVFYWVDARRHLVPYVYTSDKHPMVRCTLCTDNEPHTKKKRKPHLLIYHSITVASEQEFKRYFVELPGLRVFPHHLLTEYIAPIYEVLLAGEELVAIPKTRDMFATWMVVTFYAWQALFHSERQILFQSENAQKTNELVARVKCIAQNQPKWLRSVHPGHFGEGVSKAGKFTIPTLQSEIWGLPQGADKIRQFHPTAIFSDEAAFNPEAGETFAAAKPAIQNGGQYTAISSANIGWFMRVVQDTLE